MSIKDRLQAVSDRLTEVAESDNAYFRARGALPSRKETISVVKNLQALMFPACFAVSDDVLLTPRERLDKTFLLVKRQIEAALACVGGERCRAEELAMEIIARIPDIKEALLKDARAIYEGDPAATSMDEVILAYPGFYAISIYRIAHEFYLRRIPYVSRLMTEYAHEKTGIDIHAGASIGEYFCIDHGTGIVIGETTVIGDRVKIYQGVTLGARSFELDENGNPVKGIKRHPDIGNDCIIYANATILGGNTKIGDGAVIGGNVWLTRSVEKGRKVYYEK